MAEGRDHWILKNTNPVRQLFSLYRNGLDKKESNLFYGDDLGHLAMLAIFDAMFEMVKHA